MFERERERESARVCCAKQVVAHQVSVVVIILFIISTNLYTLDSVFLVVFKVLYKKKLNNKISQNYLLCVCLPL